MKQILILTIFLSLFFIPCLAQNFSPTSIVAENRKAIRITSKDKIQIIESVLSDFDYLNRPFKIENKEVIYVSRENIPHNFVPNFFHMTFVLLSPQEIEEKIKTGFRYYAFEEFKVAGSRVLISFSHIYRDSSFQIRRGGSSGSPDLTNGIRYEFRKFSGKWYGRKVSGYASGS